MKSHRIWLTFLLMVTMVAASVPGVAADIGPKPKVTIKVTYRGQPLTDSRFAASLLACVGPGSRPFRQSTSVPNRPVLRDPSGCVWQEPVLPVWGGNCQDGECQFSYMLPDRFRFAIKLPSQSREFLTDVGERHGLLTLFSADLSPDGTGRLQTLYSTGKESEFDYLAAVRFYGGVAGHPELGPSERLSEWAWMTEGFGRAILLTIGVELLIVFGYTRIANRPAKRPLMVGLIGNAITLPLVWAFAGALDTLGGATLGLVGLGIAEFVAWLFEGVLYTWLGRLPASRAFLLSLAANLASFGLGVVAQ